MTQRRSDPTGSERQAGPKSRPASGPLSVDCQSTAAAAAAVAARVRGIQPVLISNMASPLLRLLLLINFTVAISWLPVGCHHHHHHQQPGVATLRSERASEQSNRTGPDPAQLEPYDNGTSDANLTFNSQDPGSLDEETSWDKGVRLVVIALYSVVFIIGVCGNALIITVISKSKRDTTVTDIFIGNLAAADVGLLLGLVFLNTTMSKRRWIFGSLACKVS